MSVASTRNGSDSGSGNKAETTKGRDDSDVVFLVKLAVVSFLGGSWKVILGTPNSFLSPAFKQQPGHTIS